MVCPKCGFERREGAIECLRCGIVFAKWQAPPPADDPELMPQVYDGRMPVALAQAAADEAAEEIVPDGRVGRYEWKILGIGLAAAIVVYALPLTRFIFSALVTLFHELGHAVLGWLLGYPSIPAFDFVYGGGFTPRGEFHVSIALVIAAAFAYGIWLFRENRTTMIVIGSLFLVWLFVVSAEWRRELIIAGAGHAFEFILAGILFYQALAGVGWKIPEVERPLGAFVAFFVQIHSMLFAWRLTRDPDFLAWYREGKGGALMNDLEVIALDLHIHTPLNPGIIGTARLLLLFSLLPMVVALVWYFQRARWHRLLRSLTLAQMEN